MEIDWANLINRGLGVLATVTFIPVAIGLSNIFCTAINNIGRNPGAADRIMPVTVLGFALTEAIALFAMLIAFLVMFT